MQVHTLPSFVTERQNVIEPTVLIWNHPVFDLMVSFVQFLRNAVKLVVVIGTFFLFGYLELQYRCGFVVAILVGLYLFRNGSQVIPALLVIGNIAASYFAIKPLIVLSFLVLNCALFLTETKSADDTKVVLRPYESEVRSILFKNEPGLLHTVDALLNEHEGREKELIYKLNKQYEGASPRKTPSKNVRTPAKAEPTPVRESASFKSQPSPREDLWRVRSPQQNTFQSPQNTQNTDTVSTTVSRIKSILRTRDPALFKSVDRMLQEYQGREEDLLQEVQQEYQVENEPQEGGYEDHARQVPATSQSETSPLRQSEDWYPAHGSYRTLDGRPAARVSVDRGFASPYSQYSNNATPRDLHSVESVHAGERIAPFSPRVVSIPRNSYSNPDGYANNTSGAYREELAQAPYNNYTANTNSNTIYDDDTPRYRPTHSTSTSTNAYNNTNINTNTQAYRNSVIHQAQEDARREMQARIDARWGPKPNTNNNTTNNNHSSSGGMQQRRGYSYGEN